MSFGIRNHETFQRAALVLVGVGSGLCLVTGTRAWGTIIGLPAPGPVLVGVAAIGLALVVTQLSPQRVPVTTWLLALATLAIALAAAVVAWPGLHAAFLHTSDSPTLLVPLGQLAAGALFGLISGVGLLGAHLTRTGTALPTSKLAPEERALVERAAAAHQRLAHGLASDRSPDARRLQQTARAMTLEVLALAERASDLGAELRAVDRTALAARAEDLGVAAAATSDPAARADFTRAARAAAELSRHIGDLGAAADRVRARLALQVGALETAALALATRRASAVADDALALAPLVDRLEEAGAGLRAEASALAELASPGS